MERRLIWPNLFVDSRPEGVTIRQVLPLAAGRCRVRVRSYGSAAADDFMPAWERHDLVAIETTLAPGHVAEGGAASKAFRAWLAKAHGN